MVLKYTPTDYGSDKSCKQICWNLRHPSTKTSAVCVNSCYPEAD